MKAPKVLALPAIAVLFTSCLTPAYRDSDFFYEDRSAGIYGGDGPFSPRHRLSRSARSVEPPEESSSETVPVPGPSGTSPSAAAPKIPDPLGSHSTVDS